MLCPLLLLALSQAPDTNEGNLKKAERLAKELLGRKARATDALEIEPAPEGEKARLRYDKEVWCAELPKTKSVPSGQYRVQCDDEAHLCLAAPNKVLRDGVESE